MMLLGIDPGQSTGLAVFRGGKLAALETIRPHEIERTLRALKPAGLRPKYVIGAARTAITKSCA